jgi:hypothetical protein
MFSTLAALALATATQPAAAQGDLAAANAWLGLVDAKRWNDSWANAGTMFKSKLAEASWASTIQSVREPLGAVSSRSFKSRTKTSTLPGVPDGEYEVVQFQTSFAKKALATETVVLSHEPSGWKVDGYFIR